MKIFITSCLNKTIQLSKRYYSENNLVDKKYLNMVKK